MIGRRKLLVLMAIAVWVIAAAGAAPAANYTKVDDPALNAAATTAPQPSSSERATYNGTLRIYIVEPVSRYLDYTNRSYSFGMLGFALNQAITLNDGQILTDTVTFSSTGMTLNNIKAVMAVFNVEGHPAYSDPDTPAYPFTAHWVDASAGSTPGVVGIDKPTAPYTHTVLVEEGTRHGCGYCPITRSHLETLYESGLYQFNLVAMVTDNSQTSAFMTATYNMGYTPTVYYDGGHGVSLGGVDDETFYSSHITAASTRAVAPLKIAVRLDYVSSTQVKVEYTVKTANVAPPAPPAPSGPAMVRRGTTQTYTAAATDPDGDRLQFRWSFDKDDSTAWTGPYNPGIPCQVDRTWPNIGEYWVKFQTKDYWDSAPGWGDSLLVTVYQCGDADGSAAVSISDAVYLINYIFAGGQAPDPLLSGDADCSNALSISDAVFLINYIFAGGPAPCSTCP
ncbi:MAG: hypothetical protein IT585_11265 [candidate division Zixibacteria bacterium]|nr:hypothetical protein [candidate division Zixibacteria bacterium]